MTAKARRALTGPFTLKLSRCVGRRDFAGAVRYLEEYLREYPRDVAAWTFLAQCHLWAGSASAAIEASLAALKLDPNTFASLRMLSQIHAEADAPDQAVAFIRRGLENFPAPVPGISKRTVRAFRLLEPFLPRRLRAGIEADLPELQDPNNDDRRWYAWAKEYLQWYDARTGGQSAPVVH